MAFIEIKRNMNKRDSIVINTNHIVSIERVEHLFNDTYKINFVPGSIDSFECDHKDIGKIYKAIGIDS